MKKVNIEICIGTTCFVMGASQLQGLEDSLPEDIADKVEIKEVRCMDFCKQQDHGYQKGPFVKINDKIIGEANVSSVIYEIREALK